MSTNEDSASIRVATLRIEGLFNTRTVRVEFCDSPVTLLYGTNGAGKSTVLRVLHALLDVDLAGIDREPIGAARVTFSDGGILSYTARTRQWTETRPDGDELVGVAWEAKPPSPEALQDPGFRSFLRQNANVIVLGDSAVDASGREMDAHWIARLHARYSGQERPQVFERRRKSVLSIFDTLAGLATGDYDAGSRPTRASRRYARPTMLISSDRLSEELQYPPANERATESGDRILRRPIGHVASQLAVAVRAGREEARKEGSALDGSFSGGRCKRFKLPSRDRPKSDPGRWREC